MIDLNDVGPAPRHNLAAVRERLSASAADWVPHLFPQAKLAHDRRALRCADLSGRPPRKEGSCTIYLHGPYAGWGFDYATGERAGPIDLIAQATGLSDGALFDEAARIAGLDLPATPAPRRPKLDHSADIERLLAGAAPVTGTVGETYLLSRGLADPGCPDLLFHPDLPDFDTRRGWPGLIALPRLADGTRAPGIHRTFLLDDGSAKAPAGKKMLGSVAEAAVRLFPPPEDGHLGVAEGIETALAAHALFGTAVWAALSADGMANAAGPRARRRSRSMRTPARPDGAPRPRSPTASTRRTSRTRSWFPSTATTSTTTSSAVRQPRTTRPRTSRWRRLPRPRGTIQTASLPPPTR